MQTCIDASVAVVKTPHRLLEHRAGLTAVAELQADPDAIARDADKVGDPPEGHWGSGLALQHFHSPALANEFALPSQ